MRGVVLLVRRRDLRPRKPRHWLGKEPGKIWMVVVNSKWWYLTGKAGVGIWATALHVHQGERIELDKPDYKRRRRVKKKKLDASSEVGVPHLAAIESVVLGKLHPIVAHCAVCQYDDGSPRKPGWITVKTLGSAWVLEAKDPDSCAKLTVVQSTLDDALALLSVLLESDEAPWERDPWMVQQAQKGKKK